jgi:hypothetical protein
LTWNLRHEGYTDFEGRIFWAAGNNGPVTAPGDYRVRLRVEGRAQERDFTVRIDPRLVDQVSIGDLQERFELAMDVRDRVSEANEAVLRVRDIKSSIDDRVEDSENLELKSLGATVKDRLAAVEGEIYQVRNESNQDPLNFPIKLNNKLASLLGIIESAEARPTAQVYEVFEMLSGQLDTELQQLTLIIQQDLARLNELLRSLGMDPIESQQIITE